MRIGIHSEQHEHGEQANVYRETLDPVTQVGLVVHVHPADDSRAGLAALSDDVATVYAWGKDWLPAAATLAEKAAANNVLYGTPAQIAESISAFPAFGLTTELQFSVAYRTTDRGQRLAAIEAIAGEIAPLGWKPEGES